MSECTEAPEKKAKRLGLTLVRPEPDEVFIDLDSTDALDLSDELIALYETVFLLEDLTHVRTTPSRTPGHHHRIMRLDRPVKDATERVLLQLALGSDRKRELLALKQIYEGLGDDSSVFFEAA